MRLRFRLNTTILKALGLVFVIAFMYNFLSSPTKNGLFQIGMYNEFIYIYICIIKASYTLQYIVGSAIIHTLNLYNHLLYLLCYVECIDMAIIYI